MRISFPFFARRHCDHSTGTGRSVFGHAMCRDLDDRAVETGIADQHVRASTEDEERFPGRIQITNRLDQLCLGLGGDHPACGTADPQRRMVGQHLAPDRLRARLCGLRAHVHSLRA